MSGARALTVVLMSYNEAPSLEATYSEIRGVLQDTTESVEILIVDDGSTDGTQRLADAISARDPFARVIHHATNLGLGGVYRTGFREARGDSVTFFPADGQFPATIIADFLPLLSRYDIVLGYLPRRNRAITGRLLSAAERLLYNALFGRLPRFQGILMFRRSLLSRYALRSEGRGWAVLMEFILRCARDGVSITSVPTDVRPREHGTSKVNNLRTIYSNFRQMLELRQILEAPETSGR